MGDPRKLRKKYEPPKHPWQKARIDEENRFTVEYGTSNKKEIWRARTLVRKYREIARTLVGLPATERKGREDALTGKLISMGVLKEGASIDNVLSVKVEDVLERRLQTIVWRKGICSTIEQARQFIVHGHIAVSGRKATSPGMLITVEQEKTVGWYGKPIVIVLKKAAAVAAVADAAQKAEKPAAEKKEEEPKKKEGEKEAEPKIEEEAKEAKK